MISSFLMNLELRLHLAAEDVDAALEMDSARALQRIPAAVQEILHLRVPFLLSLGLGWAAVDWAEVRHAESPGRRHAPQADATCLKGDIRMGLSLVSAAASAASINVATLAELDLAKSRMEAACSTLQVTHHITSPVADLAT